MSFQRREALETLIWTGDDVTDRLIAWSREGRSTGRRATRRIDDRGYTLIDRLPNLETPEAARRPEFPLASRWAPVSNWFPDRILLGRDGEIASVNLIMLHTCEGTKRGTIDWFRSRQSMVSGHYLIGLDGEIVQMVREGDTALHGGGATINPFAIGVFFEGYDAKNQWTRAQVLAGALLVRYLIRKYNVEVDSWHIRPFRKSKAPYESYPGENFRWHNFLNLVRPPPGSGPGGPSHSPPAKE